jgi:hypothetical protein
MSFVSGYHSSAAEDSELLGCNGALLGGTSQRLGTTEPPKRDRVPVQ